MRMAARYNAVTANVTGSTKTSHHTITGLKRWSCQTKELPPVPLVESIHIYDFDNTLFRSPLPNAKLWNSYTISRLQNQDVFANGGWWHDRRILEVTGRGIEVEESRAWSGWWNEHIVELARISTSQKQSLNVLLTGRSERQFSELIQRMVGSCHLDFDMVCLKPEVGPRSQRFASTMQYKQALLEDLIYTYHEAAEIVVYEDRPKQTKGFRDFFYSLNQVFLTESSRRPLKADVVQVADQATVLDPVVETAEVQGMINRHNAQLPPLARHLEIRRTAFFTGYMLAPADTAKLLDLVKVPGNMPESDIRYLASNVLIAPRPAERVSLTRIGGLGAKQQWQVTGFAFYQSSVWAVRVAPIPGNSIVQTHHSMPMIVLATYKGAKPDLASNIKSWQSVPIDKQYILQTEVGEKVQLRIETTADKGDEKPQIARRGVKRRLSPNANQGPRHPDNRPSNPSTEKGQGSESAMATGKSGGATGHWGGKRGQMQMDSQPIRSKVPRIGPGSMEQSHPLETMHHVEQTSEIYGVNNSEHRANIPGIYQGLPYGQ